MLTLAAAAAFLPLSSFAGGCGGCSGSKAVKASYDKTPKADIVDTAAAACSFDTLVAAVKAASLADTLKGEGPFTHFAATDEAFAALPEGTVNSLLLPKNKNNLVAIPTYHVVPAKVKSTDVSAGEAPTVNDQTATI